MSSFNYLTVMDLLQMTEVLKLMIVALAAGIMVGAGIMGVNTVFRVAVERIKGACVYLAKPEVGRWCAKLATSKFDCEECDHYEERRDYESTDA